ncbi:MAG: mechanosensitive ion channel family protein, partial [Candidatus Micrarchaeaceae archaeon]
MKTHHYYLVGFLLALAAGAVLTALAGYLLTTFGLSASGYGDALKAVIIMAFGYAALRMLTLSILRYGKLRPRLEERLLAKLVSVIGYVMILLFILAEFNINLTGVLISAGFLGIVIGLAAQSTLGNLFAGISMMAAKPFAKGDRIMFTAWQYGTIAPSYTHRAMAPGYTGVIEEIGLMYTKVKKDDGTELYVPNGTMNGAAIVNYTVSDVIDVRFRLELPMSMGFSAFRDGVEHEVKRHK